MGKIQTNLNPDQWSNGERMLATPYTAFKNNKIYLWSGGNGVNADAGANILTVIDTTSPNVKTIKNINPFSSIGQVWGDVNNTYGFMETTTNQEDNSLYFIGRINGKTQWPFIKYDLETNSATVLNSNIISSIGPANASNVWCCYQLYTGSLQYNTNLTHGFFPKTSNDTSIFFALTENAGALKVVEVNW